VGSKQNEHRRIFHLATFVMVGTNKWRGEVNESGDYQKSLKEMAFEN
jgi:hypothetical protein